MKLKDALCHCRHILELDFLRDDVVHKDDYNEPVYAYMYGIRETPIKVNREVAKLSHLLFYEYEVNPPVFIQERHSVSFNCSIINVVKSSVLIPKVFTAKLYRELTPLMSVNDAIECMKSNVRIMNSKQTKDLCNSTVMIHMNSGTVI